MLKKVINIKKLNETISSAEELEYWMKKTPEERISAVEILRKQTHGSSARLQRIVRIVQHPRC